MINVTVYTIFIHEIHAFKADRLPMIVVAKKYICVATVHQKDV